MPSVRKRLLKARLPPLGIDRLVVDADRRRVLVVVRGCRRPSFYIEDTFV
jgi:hypothetical protein